MKTLLQFLGGFLIRRVLIVVIAFLMLFAFCACKKQTPGTERAGSGTPATENHQPFKAGKVYEPDMANCNGFTAADAAAILGAPASKFTAKTDELYAGNWQCVFDSGNTGKTMSFNVSVARSAEEAAGNMNQYRSHLETAGSVAPFKENLPKGAYSDISGIGDEAVWTDMNVSLAVRQGNVTIHVLMPKDKTIQMEVAEKFLSTMK
jgi:hypothetical protein